MSRYIFIFLCFLYVNSFSQNNSTFQFELFNLNNSTVFFHSDTILGIPVFSENNIYFTAENSFNEFIFFDKKKLIVDFSDFIEDRNKLSFKLFSENNLLFFGFPKAKNYYSFGYKHSAYFDLNISNELINLFWNGNNQYLDNIVSFQNNTGSFIQFSSIFFQYSSNLSENFRVGARLSLLHGINYFNLEPGDFSLQFFSESITPFASNINTDIFYQSSNANFFGFSNPGLSLNLAFNYNLNKWSFSTDVHNLGFIFWHKKSSQNQSTGSHFFDGVDYSMDQVFSEELSATLDTLEDIFALNRISNKSFVSQLPMRINFHATYSYKPFTDFFIDYYGIQNNNSGYTHNVFFGFSKILRKHTGFKTAYNFNNYSLHNIQFTISRKFENILININTNNLLSIFNLRESNYLHLQAGFYYFF